MWISRKNYFGGNPKFFRVSFSHDNLGNFFQTNFALMQHHKYSLNELDNMLPWERDIYVSMLMKYLEEEAERIKLLKQQRK